MTYSVPEDKIASYLSDRPRFKFYAAAEHLNHLKSINEAHGSIVAAKARIPAEMEIDCFLTQLVGAVDSLLLLINERLDLGLAPSQATFDRVQSALTAKTNKIDLLLELEQARQHGNWYWQILELRNNSMRTTLLPTHIALSQSRVFFKDPRDPTKASQMDTDVITYLEKCLFKVENMMERIRSSDPIFM